MKCGTWFTTFQRKCNPSVPGRLEYVQQKVVEQVTGWNLLYSSCTRLVCTLRGGVGRAFSFNLHPLTLQYVINPTHALRMRKGGQDDEREEAKPLEIWIYWSWCTAEEQDVEQEWQQQKKVNRDSGAEAVKCVAKKVVWKCKARVRSIKCYVEDFDAAMSCGRVIIVQSVLAEELGGKANNGCALRVIDTLTSFLLTMNVLKRLRCRGREKLPTHGRDGIGR